MTMASLVCAMSEMTPSVMMSSTKYWEPSSTAAAELGAQPSGDARLGRRLPPTSTAVLVVVVGVVGAEPSLTGRRG